MSHAPVNEVNQRLARSTGLFGAWCGVYYCALLFLGWWVVGGFFPLHEPSAGAEEITAFFRGDITGIRIGMIIVMWGAAVFLPFTAVLARFIAKIEGRPGVLTYSMLMAGFANAMLTFYPPLWWLINAFRPLERTAEQIYLLNDIAWLQFIGGLSLIMPMFIVVAVAAFHDRSENPVFPRWSGYFSLWVFVLFLPDQLLFFFKSGPFAWNGLFAFWIPLTVFCSWFLVMFYLMRKAILARHPGAS
jgi:hypothetical protein